MRVQKFFSGKGRTKQSFKDQCDANLIIRRYRNVTGGDFVDSFQNVPYGRFGDFTQVNDYRSALDQINRAKAGFEALPLDLRQRFKNDPAVFMDFVENPANSQELVNLGLVNPKVEEKAKVSPVSAT